jgi:tRNA threonylcarbamoyladenosine biosynthesis protein TsaB
MPWLAIDTATDQASVAVAGDTVLAELAWQSGRNHTSELTAAVADVLSRSGTPVGALEGVAVAIGPGSYTGLRVGLSLAKGLALVGGIPVIGVPTAHALAAALSPPVAERSRPLHVMLRAGRGRHAIATYGPTPDDWPPAESVRSWPLAEWLAANRPPGLVAGELTAEEAAAVRSAGFAVTCPAASVRRAAFLVCAAQRGHAGDLAGLADLVPVYLGGAPA